jgi:hypothetical protein
MKFVVKQLVLGALVLSLASAVAFGKVKTKTVTFAEDMTVEGTVLKAGEYRVKFDDQTNDLEISKNGKVVVKTKARLEARTDKARDTKIRSIDNKLISITFGGDRNDIVVGATSSQVGS